MKKYILTALTALVCSAALLHAIPARPGKFLYTQPDGSKILIQRFGDEWNHWTVDASGSLLVMDNGYYRIATFTDADRIAQQRAASPARRARVNRVRAKSAVYALTHGERHIPVILAAYSDQAFTIESPAEMFNNLLNQSGYSYNGATGSVKDFYQDNSANAFTPIFDVYGPVTLPSPMATYGGNVNDQDKAPELALFQACKLLDDVIDFSQYDYDNDGYVDMVLFYYPGLNEAEWGPEDNIWPHSWNLTYTSNRTITGDDKFKNGFDRGVKVDNYFCTSELSMVDYDYNYNPITAFCGIGTTCHEFGHSLGLPDFYDTDYGDSGSTFGTNHGCAADLYSYSTMCSGPYNNTGNTPPYLNVEELLMLGWVEESSAIEVLSSPGYKTLPAVGDGRFAYKIPATTSGEYFLLECRALNGWDTYLPGGAGLIVYHIDKSSTSVGYSGNTATTAYNLWNNWESYNAINENAQHPCGYLVPAQDQSRIAQECYTASDYGFTPSAYQAKPYDETKIPFPGSKNVNSYKPVDWKSVELETYLEDITYNASTRTVSFRVVAPSDDIDYNVIANPGNGVYTAGSRFSFELVESTVRVPESVVWYYDDEPIQADSVTLTTGSHTVEAHITLTTGLTKIVTLEIQVN